MDYKERLLQAIAYEIVYDDTGFYPASVKEGDVITKRTEWQDGWNQCAMQMTKKVSVVAEYIEQLPQEVQEYILQDVIYIQVVDDKCTMFINCNDLFFWACADSEEFELNKLESLKQAYRDSPEHGDLLWCCRQRGMRPQQAYYSYLGKDKKLFNKCGKKRRG